MPFSPAELKSLGQAEDVGISPNTVKKYIHILEALYIVFRITPFSRNIARSLLKEPKIYFFDTGLVKGDDGIKFENLVAVSLYKHTLSRIDYHAEDRQFSYLRTKDQKEVDFALIHDQKIESIIEVKDSKPEIGKGLEYFQRKYDLEAIQVVKELRREYSSAGVIIRRGDKFLQELDL